MDFSNTLPSESGNESAFRSEKNPPHVFTSTKVPPSDITSDVEAPRCRNVRWTPLRCAKYDYILHVVSLTLGTFTFVAYVYDLAKSASYQVKLPIGLLVVDDLSIAFLAINNGWSLVYFITGMYTRMSKGEMSRKRPSIVDIVLHCLLLGMADTTLAMRSGGNCDKNRAVGGCLASRKGLMIATGVVMILVR
jgi:hypothetical protein